MQVTRTLIRMHKRSATNASQGRTPAPAASHATLARRGLLTLIVFRRLSAKRAPLATILTVVPRNALRAQQGLPIMIQIQRRLASRAMSVTTLRKHQLLATSAVLAGRTWILILRLPAKVARPEATRPGALRRT